MNYFNKLISKTGWLNNQDTINRKGTQKHKKQLKQLGHCSVCDISVEAQTLFHTFKNVFGVQTCVYDTCTFSVHHQI